MFLNRLSSNEKEAFLQLAYHISYIDGEFAESEQAVIHVYCAEMGINDSGYNKDSFNLNEITSVFAKSQSQKIVLIELMGLVFADGVFSSEEQAVINSISNNFNIDSETVNKYAEWTKAILSLTIEGESFFIS